MILSRTNRAQLSGAQFAQNLSLQGWWWAWGLGQVAKIGFNQQRRNIISTKWSWQFLGGTIHRFLEGMVKHILTWRFLGHLLLLCVLHLCWWYVLQIQLTRNEPFILFLQVWNSCYLERTKWKYNWRHFTGSSTVKIPSHRHRWSGSYYAFYWWLMQHTDKAKQNKETMNQSRYFLYTLHVNKDKQWTHKGG